jgi:ABC-type multidrug transport system ATPase subunit
MRLAVNVNSRRPDPLRRPTVERISVYKLFGRYSYANLSLDHASDSPTGTVAILYGDNGSGKTTILNLLYSSLCWIENEGNRSRLGQTPFASLKVKFHDGTVIEIVKEDGQLIGSYNYIISREHHTSKFHMVFKDDKVVNEGSDMAGLHAELRRLNIGFLFFAA